MNDLVRRKLSGELLAAVADGKTVAIDSLTNDEISTMAQEIIELRKFRVMNYMDTHRINVWRDGDGQTIV